MKRGLVLEGGGARGAYQIGALKALRELGYREFSAITGSSVGAINGALYAMGDFDYLYDLWYNARPSRIIKGDDKTLERLMYFDFGGADMKKIHRFVRGIFTDGGLDISPLKELLRERVDEDKLRGQDLRFGLVTVSLTERKPLEIFLEDIPEGELVDYILASANLPVFKMEKKEGNLFIDGGFYDNVPLRLMLETDVEEVIVLRLNSKGIVQKVKDVDRPVIEVAPREDLGGMLQISEDKARYNMALGYHDTHRTFRHLRGDRYYIERDVDDATLLHHLEKVGEKDLEGLRRLMGADPRTRYPFIFEAVFPMLRELLGCDARADYTDVMLAVYEHFADKLSVERFHIYTTAEFLETVEENFDREDVAIRESLAKKLPDRLKNNPLYFQTVKEEILYRVFKIVRKR
jgi:NTE family protein